MYTLAPYLKHKKSSIEKINKEDLKDYKKMKSAVCSCPHYKRPKPKPVKRKIVYK